MVERIKVSFSSTEPTEDRVKVAIIQSGSVPPDGTSDIAGPDVELTARMIPVNDSMEFPIPDGSLYLKVTREGYVAPPAPAPAPESSKFSTKGVK
jgi:hypothetical protein